MSREIISTDKAPQAIGTYSQAVKVGSTVYLSGQIALVPETMEIVEGGIEAQIHQVFKNLSAVCEAAGGSLQQIAKLNIFLTDLSNFATVNAIMADVITNELEPQLKKIASKTDSKWFSRESLSQLTFNIIFKANFGENVGFDNNPLCKQLAQDLVDMVSWKIAKRAAWLFVFPNAAPMLIPKSYFQPCYDIKQRINDNLKKLIKQRNSMEKNVNSQEDMTFMDHTRQMVGTAYKSTEHDEVYTESQEVADIFLLFLAGTDTTSISTEWGLLLLSRQPDIQEKVRNELLSVLNKTNIDYKSNPVNVLYDIKLLLQLPLFRACIHEILRISCVARTGVPHKVLQSVPITFKDGRKYEIPAGTRVFYNVEGIHYNACGSENWKNEEYGLNYQQICLENWLEDNSTKFYQNPSFITFGYGKRVKFDNYICLCF